MDYLPFTHCHFLYLYMGFNFFSPMVHGLIHWGSFWDMNAKEVSFCCREYNRSNQNASVFFLSRGAWYYLLKNSFLYACTFYLRLWSPMLARYPAGVIVCTRHQKQWNSSRLTLVKKPRPANSAINLYRTISRTMNLKW